MRNLIKTLGVFSLFLLGHAVSAPLGTSFTFQGELKSTGVTVDGPINFEFEPFDAVSGGNSLAPHESQTLTLTNGIFSTQLDFGDAIFAGEAVWIEVRVRQGSGNFTTLSPRQNLSATPYALHAQFVGIDAVSGAEIADGSIQSADLAAGSVGTSQIDTAQVQRRISSTCPVGSAIRQVAIDGGITCQEPVPDSDWLASDNGRLQNNTGVQVQGVASAVAPFSIRHNSSLNVPTAALIETQQDFARLSFYSEPDPTFWTIAANSAPNTADDVMHIFNSSVGNILSVRGNRRVGIRTSNPQATLHVASGDLRINDLSHSSATPTPVFVDGEGTLVPKPTDLQYLTIGAAAFRTTDGSIPSQIFRSVVFPQSNIGSLSAPLQLRDGDVIEEMIVYFRDDAASNVSLFLASAALGSNSATVLAIVESSGASTDYRSESTPAIATTVNNLERRYYFIVQAISGGWTGNEDLGIQAVVIGFR